MFALQVASSDSYVWAENMLFQIAHLNVLAQAANKIGLLLDTSLV